MTVGERIKNTRKMLGLSVDDVAAKLGKHRATVYRYESNEIENLPADVLVPLAAALETTPAYLMGWDNDEESSSSKADIPNLPDIIPIHDVQRVPVVGLSAAGAPVYAEQDIEGYIWTDRNHGGVYFGVRIRGTSMNAAGIDDGDIVLIRKQDTVEDGEIALVLIDDGATVKRFHQEGDTVILSPQSTDPANQVQVYNLKDNTIRILGKVVETRKNF